jgi:parvulin-like peptidyl-prolyl isomerase
MGWSRLILLAVSGFFFCSAAAAQVPGVVAAVNGADITRERLQATVDFTLEESGMNYGGITRPQQFKQMQRQALDLLIAQELLWQAAEREGFVAAPDEVDLAFAEVRADFPSDQALSAYLVRKAFTEEGFREDLRRRISIRKWAYASLGETIEISDPEVHEFYVANQVRFVQEEMINVRHILISVEPDADSDQSAAARERINTILKEARAGAEFADLARKHSDGPSAADGGELGFAPRGVFVQPFEDAAFALERGKISGITRTGYGFHIIELVDRREAHVVAESDVAPAIRRQLFEDKLLAATAARVDDLRQEASIEIHIPL